MPLPVSYANLGDYAAAQLAVINTGAAGATTAAFLGARAPVVTRHFPGGVDHIRFSVVNNLPAPGLDGLARDLGYTNGNDTAFRNACTALHANTLVALQTFSNPASIVGITYDDVIYLTQAVQNNLAVILHELVHTLQWSRFGPSGFLRKYIQGWITNYPNYPGNPAETRAYHYQNAFGTLAANAGVTLDATLYGTLAGLAPTAPAPPALTTLLNLASLNINEANATTGM